MCHAAEGSLPKCRQRNGVSSSPPSSQFLRPFSLHVASGSESRHALWHTLQAKPGAKATTKAAAKATAKAKSASPEPPEPPEPAASWQERARRSNAHSLPSQRSLTVYTSLKTLLSHIYSTSQAKSPGPEKLSVACPARPVHVLLILVTYVRVSLHVLMKMQGVRRRDKSEFYRRRRLGGTRKHRDAEQCRRQGARGPPHASRRRRCHKLANGSCRPGAA